MIEWLRLAAAVLAQSDQADQADPGRAEAAAGAAELVVVEPQPAVAVQTGHPAEVVVAGAEAADQAGRG